MKVWYGFLTFPTLTLTVTLTLGLGVKVIEVGAIGKLGSVSYSPSIVTMAVSVAVCEIFSVKEWCDLENGG